MDELQLRFILLAFPGAFQADFAEFLAEVSLDCALPTIRGQICGF